MPWDSGPRHVEWVRFRGRVANGGPIRDWPVRTQRAVRRPSRQRAGIVGFLCLWTVRTKLPRPRKGPQNEFAKGLERGATWVSSRTRTTLKLTTASRPVGIAFDVSADRARAHADRVAGADDPCRVALVCLPAHGARARRATMRAKRRRGCRRQSRGASTRWSSSGASSPTPSTGGFPGRPRHTSRRCWRR
jgi:hypothetical protein